MTSTGATVCILIFFHIHLLLLYTMPVMPRAVPRLNTEGPRPRHSKIICPRRLSGQAGRLRETSAPPKIAIRVSIILQQHQYMMWVLCSCLQQASGLVAGSSANTAVQVGVSTLWAVQVAAENAPTLVLSSIACKAAVCAHCRVGHGPILAPPVVQTTAVLIVVVWRVRKGLRSPVARFR